MTEEHAHNKNIDRDTIIEPDFSKKETLDNFCMDMQNHIKATLSWQWKEKKWDEHEKNTFLDTLPDMLNHIEEIKNKTLTPLDIKFLTLMERYYFVIANKPELKTKDHPQHYAEYLSIVRDDIAKFYFECAIQNNYDLLQNPIHEVEGLPEILAICNFFDGYQDAQGCINWKEYYEKYFNTEGTKLSHLLEDIINSYPIQQKFEINTSLLFALFDLNNLLSKEILFHILTYHLEYSDKKATKLIEEEKNNK